MARPATARVANIQVFVRVRPPKRDDLPVILTYPDPSSCQVPEMPRFMFDAVFPGEKTQKDIYLATTKPLIQDFLGGYNCSLFAYGQTSSGKSHTIYGSTAQPGIIPRLCDDVWKAIPPGTRVSLSCVEIYLEQIFDLLEQKGDRPKVIRELPDGSTYIEGLTEVYVSSPADIQTHLQTCDINKTIAATLMNDRSSRSHCVFQLHISLPNGVHSRFSVTDLAGSERVKKSGATGVTLTQAQAINKSLFNLSNVIHLLSDPKTKNGHIPFRDSKLTRILQDSLGGTAKTTVIITCLPTEDSLEETISTLRFGARCKLVCNKPKVNTAELTIDVMKERLAAAEAEIERLRAKKDSPKSVMAACERCPELLAALEEMKLREEAARTSLSVEEMKENIDKYLVKPLPENEPLSNAELRQKISEYATGQRYLVLRQHYLLRSLASRNALIEAFEKRSHFSTSGGPA